MAGIQIQSTQLGGVNGAGTLVDTKSLSTLTSSYPSFFSGTSIMTIDGRVTFDASDRSADGICDVLFGDGSKFEVDDQDGDVTVFTSSGTFAANSSASYRILVIGGGAGGSATIASAGYAGLDGGGAGGYSIKTTSTSLSGNYTVTVGTGGAGGYTVNALAHGSAGGTSSVSGTGLSMSATGGVGGGSRSGGTGSGGDINGTGGSGTQTTGGDLGLTTSSPDNYAQYSGTGGGYVAPNGGTVAPSGTNYGAGGGCIYNNDYDSGPDARGGAGASGLVVFFKV